MEEKEEKSSDQSHEGMVDDGDSNQPFPTINSQNQ